MFNSLGPHGLEPGLQCPWEFPGINTVVGCLFLLQCVCVCVCIYMHTYINVFVYTQTHIYMHTLYVSCVCVCWLLSYVQLCTTPWTVALQAALSLGLSRQEYWSRLPFLSPVFILDPA